MSKEWTAFCKMAGLEPNPDDDGEVDCDHLSPEEMVKLAYEAGAKAEQEDQGVCESCGAVRELDVAHWCRCCSEAYELGAAAEREACAELVHDWYSPGRITTGKPHYDMAAAIRARGGDKS